MIGAVLMEIAVGVSGMFILFIIKMYRYGVGLTRVWGSGYPGPVGEGCACVELWMLK